MSITRSSDPTELDQTFRHQNSDYEYTIHWTALGPQAGQPLVFVHGTPWSSKSWKALALAFHSKYRVYLFDRPGFGQAPDRKSLSKQKARDRKTELDADLKGQAEAFAALFQSWNFADDKLPHVVAHDNAGLVTLRAHLQHGCKYASLCLIDVVAVGPFGTPFFKTVAEGLSTYQAIPQAMFRGFIRAYIEGATFKPLSKDIMDMLIEPYSEQGVQGKEGFIREMEQAHYRDADDVMSSYGELAIPVKIIWGKNDKWIPYDKGIKLGEMIGTKEVVLVEQAGHLIMYDQPERVATELAWWLSNQKQ